MCGSIPWGVISILHESLLLPYYHVVSDDCPKHVRHLYECRDISTFVSDLEFLLKHYKPLSLDDVKAILHNGKMKRGNYFHLTFDDGFRECHDIIAPLLKRMGIPATFFVCSGFIDNHKLFYRNKISVLCDEFGYSINKSKQKKLEELFYSHGIQYRGFGKTLISVSSEMSYIIDHVSELFEFDFNDYVVKEKPYLSSQQIKSMIDDGFSIGSHSVDHPQYQNISLEMQINQTKNSLSDLEKKFQIKTKSFSFPYTSLQVSLDFFKRTSEYVDIYFGTERMKNDEAENCLQRFSLEDSKFSCEEIIKRNIVYQLYIKITGRGSVKRKYLHGK